MLGNGLIGPAVRADFRRLYPANAKTPTCCPSDDNRTKVTNSVTSARSLWWHVGPYFWPADLTRTANPIWIKLFSYGPHDKEHKPFCQQVHTSQAIDVTLRSVYFPWVVLSKETFLPGQNMLRISVLPPDTIFDFSIHSTLVC